MRYILFCLLPSLLLASAPPKVYNCIRTTSDITIDGQLKEDDWQKAAWSDPFVDIEGDLKPAPKFLTWVKMLWNDRGLYIGAELEEPQVWATISDRDEVIFHDNDFEVFLDPDGDGHEYGELEINALNTQWDLFLPKPYKDGGHAMNCWDIDGLQSAVYVNGTLNNASDTDKGWSMEIFLPWRGLELCTDHHRPPAIGEYWRMNFSRVEWDTQEIEGKYVKVPDKPEFNWVWSPQGVVDMHRPEMWGVVVFVKDAGAAPKLPADFDWPLRETAYSIYYAEKMYFDKEMRWAKSLKEINVDVPPDQEVKLRQTPMGWNAAVSPIVKDKKNTNRIPEMHIRDDAYFWTTHRRPVGAESSAPQSE